MNSVVSHRHFVVDSTPDTDWLDLLPMFREAGAVVAPEDVIGRIHSLVDQGQLVSSVIRSAGTELFGGESPAIVPFCESESSVLEAWLEEFEETTLLLFFCRPENYLESVMDQGRDPVQELEVWKRAAVRILAVYRRNRRRALVFDIEDVRLNPNSFFAACGEHFQNYGSINGELGLGLDSGGSDLVRLIARQWVEQSVELRDLRLELIASSVPLRRPALPPIDCERVFREICEGHDLEQENRTLLLELHRLQDELEGFAERESEAETRESQERIKTDQMLKSKDEQLQTIDHHRKELLAKNQSLKESQRKLLTENRTLKDGLADVKSQLATLQGSRSWRITAPLRSVRAPFIRRRLKSAKKGSDLRQTDSK